MLRSNQIIENFLISLKLNDSKLSNWLFAGILNECSTQHIWNWWKEVSDEEVKKKEEERNENNSQSDKSKRNGDWQTWYFIFKYDFTV